MYFIDVVVMLLQPTLYIFFAALSLAQFQVRKMKPTRRKQHTHGDLLSPSKCASGLGIVWSPVLAASAPVH